jgi:hypothetical protein
MRIVVIPTEPDQGPLMPNRSVPYGTAFLPGRTLVDAYPIGTVYQVETITRCPTRPPIAGRYSDVPFAATACFMPLELPVLHANAGKPADASFYFDNDGDMSFP